MVTGLTARRVTVGGMRTHPSEQSGFADASLSRRQLRWVVGTKVLLATLLVVGAAVPSVGGFAGKGMLYRLLIFLAPALVVPLWWWRRRGTYPFALDMALTIPFLLDTAGNAVGLYDHWARTDDVLHFVNWVVLIGGITVQFARMAPTAERWLLWLAGFGLGAVCIIGWEIVEYLVMRAGVGGLSLTYADTLGDLVLSTAGGGLGAYVAVRRFHPLGRERRAGT